MQCCIAPHLKRAIAASMATQHQEPLVAASHWYALLASESATAEDQSAWQRWKEAAPEHQLAWQRVEAVTQLMQQLPPHLGSKSLASPANDRRMVLKQLAVLLGIGTVTMLTYQHKPWREMLADYSTATGETRDILLPDGSRMILNTASATNVHYTDTARHIELIHGEVLIQTAKEVGAYRPFTLSTRHGTLTALGTRFHVRDHERHSQVHVSQGAVRVAPIEASGDFIILQAGQSTHFDRTGHTDIRDEEVSSAWAKGLLVVYSMSLDEFVEELARYRSGILRCDHTVQHLQVSGSFLTSDTDKVLEQLTHILPVRLQTRTRYWVTLTAA